MFDFFVIITRRERNMKNRIDKEMSERLLAPSRSKAQELINLGVVFCNDKKIDKANFLVNKEDKIIIKDNKLLKYVKTDSVFEDYTIFILFIRCIRRFSTWEVENLM